jgi:hypothetical protein
MFLLSIKYQTLFLVYIKKCDFFDPYKIIMNAVLVSTVKSTYIFDWLSHKHV